MTRAIKNHSDTIKIAVIHNFKSYRLETQSHAIRCFGGVCRMFFKMTLEHIIREWAIISLSLFCTHSHIDRSTGQRCLNSTQIAEITTNKTTTNHEANEGSRLFCHLAAILGICVCVLLDFFEDCSASLFLPSFLFRFV